MATEPLPHLETPAVASHALGLANGHPQNADDRQRWNKISDEVLVNWRRRPESCGALWSAKCQASEAPDDGKQERNGTMELIDALVNANSAPKLIKSFGASRPLFSREYNWAEQSRVRKIFLSLTEVHSAEAWNEMLKHADDSRYCLTMCLNGETDHTENHSGTPEK